MNYTLHATQVPAGVTLRMETRMPTRAGSASEPGRAAHEPGAPGSWRAAETLDMMEFTIWWEKTAGLQDLVASGWTTRRLQAPLPLRTFYSALTYPTMFLDPAVLCRMNLLRTALAGNPVNKNEFASMHLALESIGSHLNTADVNLADGCVEVNVTADLAPELTPEWAVEIGCRAEFQRCSASNRFGV